MWRWLGLCAVIGLLAGCAGFGRDTPIDAKGYNAVGGASYYGSKHQGRRTASGEPFDQNALTAAHRQLPFGTRLLVTNLDNQKTVIVRVNDRGPHTRSRIIDLSRQAAQQLGMLGSGTANVRLQTLEN